MEIVETKIADLISSEYNPRKLDNTQYEHLKASLTRFGFVDPVIVNCNPTRKNIIIGGHQRLRVWRDMEKDSVPCLFIDLSRDNERELNIRLNKNTGEFDYKLLDENFEVEELVDWGFSEDELIKDLGDKEGNGGLSISPELMESHNYLVLYFDNDLDWQTAQEKLGIESVKTPDSKEGYVRAGTGRVINGASVIGRIQ